MSLQAWITAPGIFGDALAARCEQMGVSRRVYLFKVVVADLLKSLHYPETKMDELRDYCSSELAYMERRATRSKKEDQEEAQS